MKHLRAATKFVLSLVCVLSLVFPVNSKAGEFSPERVPDRSIFALQSRLFGEWRDYRSQGFGYTNQTWRGTANLQLGGIWRCDSDAAQFQGELSTRAKSYAERVRNHSQYPSYSGQFTDNLRASNNGANGELAFALSSRIYPTRTAANLSLDFAIQRSLGRTWNTYQDKWSSPARWVIRNSSSSGAWHSWDVAVGGGIGWGRVKNMWYLPLPSDSSTKERPDLASLSQSRFRQSGYVVSLRAGIAKGRYRGRDNGTSFSLSYDTTYGYEYSTGPAWYWNWGWTDDFVIGPIAEFHRPFGSSFQLDVWGKAEVATWEGCSDLYFEGSARWLSVLSRRWKAEVWMYEWRRTWIEWDMAGHAKVAYDLDPQCEVQVEITSIYYPHVGTVRSWEARLGLTIWFSGRLDHPEVAFPSVTPKWREDYY